MSLSLEEQLMLNYFKVVGASFEEETKKVFSEILKKSPGIREDSDKKLNNTLMAINSVIKIYDMEIVATRDELTTKKIHCLIATNSSGLTQKVNFYSKQAYELLSKIIQECVLSGNGYVSEICCLNLSTSIKSNKTTMQVLLQRLIKDKWLVAEDGKVSLGMRCQLEMEMIIKKQYPNHVKYCSLCKQFMMQGYICTKCDCIAHFYCVCKYYRINKFDIPRNCPLCKKETEAMDIVLMKTSLNPADEPPAKKRKTQHCP